jgi:hypothetical protein
VDTTDLRDGVPAYEVRPLQDSTDALVLVEAGEVRNVDFVPSKDVWEGVDDCMCLSTAPCASVSDFSLLVVDVCRSLSP